MCQSSMQQSRLAAFQLALRLHPQAGAAALDTGAQLSSLERCSSGTSLGANCRLAVCTAATLTSHMHHIGGATAVFGRSQSPLLPRARQNYSHGAAAAAPQQQRGSLQRSLRNFHAAAAAQGTPQVQVAAQPPADWKWRGMAGTQAAEQYNAERAKYREALAGMRKDWQPFVEAHNRKVGYLTHTLF